MPTERQTIGRYGGLKSWANTVDRAARTRAARDKSPSSIDYHLERLDPVRFKDATDEQRLAAADAARKAYYARMGMLSGVSKRRKQGADATDEQRLAVAVAARKAYDAGMAMKSAKARRRGDDSVAA